jgi:hypothetical protein
VLAFQPRKCAMIKKISALRGISCVLSLSQGSD